EHQMGPDVRRAALQRARHGRVRRGVGGVGPRARRDQHHAAADRDSLQRLSMGCGLRGGVAAGAARARDPDRQDRPGMALRPRTGQRIPLARSSAMAQATKTQTQGTTDPAKEFPMTALVKAPRVIDYTNAGPSIIPGLTGTRPREGSMNVTVENLIKE